MDILALFSLSLYVYFAMTIFLCFNELVCRDAFIDYWINGNMLTMDIATQIYSILKRPDLKYLTQVSSFSILHFCFSLYPHCAISVNFIVVKS